MNDYRVKPVISHSAALLNLHDLILVLFTQRSLKVRFLLIMVVGKHKSCYDPALDRSGEQQPWIDAVLDQARLCAPMVALKPSLVSKDKGYVREVDKLTKRLFPPSFDKRKIGRVCRKLGRDVLVGDFRDLLARSDEAYPVSRSLPGASMNDAELLDRAKDLPISSRSRWRINRFLSSPNLLMDATKTYRDIYNALPNFPTTDCELISLHRETTLAAAADLGIPRAAAIPNEVMSEILANLDSEDPAGLLSRPYHYQALVQNDAILIRVYDQMLSSPAVARAQANVISFCPPFFEASRPQSLTDVELIPGITKLEKLFQSQTKTCLHECFHTDSVLGASDQRPFKNNEPLPPEIYRDFCDKLRFKAPEIYRYKGFYHSLLLQYLDTERGSHMAEDDAETWALYTVSRAALLVYPEYHFNILQCRSVKRRKQLLHHCSAFDCLRHPSAGSICDLPDYRPAKDFWATSGGKKRAKNVKELLEMISELVT